MKPEAGKLDHEKVVLNRLRQWLGIQAIFPTNRTGAYVNDLHDNRKIANAACHRRFIDGIPLSELWHLDFASERPLFTEAVKDEPKAEKVNVGVKFGPTWSTHWFKLQFTIPAAFKGRNPVIRWETDSEGMVYTENGEPIQGLSNVDGKRHFPIDQFKVDQRTVLWIEVTASRLLGEGLNGLINPPDPNKFFTLSRAEMCCMRTEVFDLIYDMEILLGMVENLPETSHQRKRALFVGNSIVNQCDIESTESCVEAHQMAMEFFALGNGPNQFQVIGAGHCHIDTAWLWPYAETKRKVARSWSHVLRLIDRYPHLRFTCSQAVQHKWLREEYPSLFHQVRDAVKRGSFVPEGGTWVEMDGNLPSGESFARQMLYGQKEFKKSYGVMCTEFWLPDTFGYSAQLPQMMRLGGMNRFLSSKLCWNLVNKFPHHTFKWRGIDGSQVLAHFPSGESYHLENEVKDLVNTSNKFLDKGRSNSSLLLYGFGDGGGGPTVDMMERMERMRDIAELPKYRSGTPSEFFENVEQKDMDNLCTWNGELYLELHNGTYTTMAELKRYNRLLEFKLRDVELLTAMQWLKNGGEYRSWEPEWQKVMVNQFHDVLPGTSIPEVNSDALKLYAEVNESCDKYFGEPCDAAAGGALWMNSLPWTRLDYVRGQPILFGPTQILNKLLPAKMEKVKMSKLKTGVEIQNEFLRIQLDSMGRFEHVFVMKSGEDSSGESDEIDSIEAGKLANQITLYEDIPLYWDAWDVMDYHLETRQPVTDCAEPLHSVHQSDCVVQLECKFNVGGQQKSRSQLKQLITLRAGQPWIEIEHQVDWKEAHKFMKVEFPVNISGGEPRATYETQFGHLNRPTHRNTSWDAAKFEVCGHKWADVSEPSGQFGAAILNDSKYGYSCQGNVLSLSLLRSPKAPDDQADMGSHRHRYAFMPHSGSFHQPQRILGHSSQVSVNVIQAAYQFNCPIRQISNNFAAGGLLINKAGEGREQNGAAPFIQSSNSAG